jgi:hypothetical protein
MSTQYKKDKKTAVNAQENKSILNDIKNIETTEILIQDGMLQADAADFLIFTILQYLKLHEPIHNSICFTEYTVTLCETEIDNDKLKKLCSYKYETEKYKDDNNKEYDFSKQSVLEKICNNINNTQLLDILNPVGEIHYALMCFTNADSIQGCINDHLNEIDIEINNDITTPTYQYQETLMKTSGCKKENTKKSKVLYIPDKQKYLIVTLKRYTLDNVTKITTIINKRIEVNKNIIINNNIAYAKQYKFNLRGVICKTGSAGGGHYVYISMENNTTILYDDSAIPATFNNQHDMDTKGYVFLYEKII